MKDDDKRILIVRYGEISLKGMNKPWFERALEGRMSSALSKIDGADKLRIKRSDGLFVISDPEGDIGEIAEPVTRALLRVFGIATVSPAIFVKDKHIESLCESAAAYMGDIIRDRGGGPLTFKVFGKRSDKSYPITSPDMSALIGEAVLNELAPEVSVNLRNPDVALNVHLRNDGAFIYDEKIAACGGLPLGTNGRGMVLLSGGIDSPVAAFMMARRGMSIDAVHFHSYPYTSERAQEKVEELAAIIASYVGRFRLHIINLLPAQEAIAQYCREEYMTLIVRRFMMRIAEKIARQCGSDLLITGENLGQVASQTSEAIVSTDDSVSMPVMRPLIAFDKTEIIDKAREIGTYDKSIEPYEDCCTVFLPKHPVTRPKLSAVLEQEALIPDIEGMIAEMLKTDEIKRINA